MKKNFCLFTAICIFVSVLLTSCTRKMGYSVVLWNIPEYSIPDGTIVKVHLKSNISQVYVITVPGTKEKIEVPLWKLSVPEPKSKAEKRCRRFSELGGTYAKCALDGLPVRASSQNTSKQVYRLRKNEIVRTLYKGEGVAPTNGKETLEGDWIRVLTSDGTPGWCFSYNLKMFRMNPDGTYGLGAEEAEVQETDELLEKILDKKWWPDYYSSMLSKKDVNLDNIKADYGFDTGAKSGKISIKNAVIDVSFDFAGVEKTDSREYRFNDAPVQMTVRSEKSVVVRYTDKKGMPRSFNFVALADDVDVEKAISKEKDNRAWMYRTICSFGPDFKSGNYGEISFATDGTFVWNKFKRLVPSVISDKAKNSGSCQIKYGLDKSMKSSWDGVLSMRFTEAEQKEVNFLYKKEVNGLRFAVANVYDRVDDKTGIHAVTVALPANSTVIFFQK